MQNHLIQTVADGKIIPKGVLTKEFEWVRSGLNWPRGGYNGRLLRTW